jgi:chemotaxis protein methyltransferase CheR
MKIFFPEELKIKFRNYVTGRCGLYFRDYDLKDLEGAIAKRMDTVNVASPLNYYNILTASQHREDEFRELLNLLTIKHTYFFRNEPQFQALGGEVLPKIVERKLSSLRGREAPEAISKSGIASAPTAPRNDDRPALRIWSAGCSTGEEPYTIAMVVSDVISDLEDWSIQILATDASESALAQAQKGLYSKNSVKHVDAEHLDRYFIKEGGGRDTQYAIRNTIKNMVTFGYFNLMDADYPEGFDIIFCRNVVIYFEFETIARVMSRLYPSLLDDGYLFVGYSETLQFMQDKFKMVASHDSIYYRKTRAPVREAVKEAAPEEKIDLDRALEDISRQELEAELALEAKKKPLVAKNIEELLVRIIKFMHLKEYDNALGLVDKAILSDDKNLELHYLAAEIFLNQGRVDQAKDRLSRALKADSMFMPAHYLIGCIYMQEGKINEARNSLKKALYLDKNFIMAYFYMAQIFRNEGKRNESIREYRNTLKRLAGYSDSDIVPYSGGFNAATLMSVCRDNLERLKVGG